MLNELVIELVIREMLIFKHCSMDSKEIKFLIVGFLARQILRIVRLHFRVKSSKEREVGDNVLYLKHADVCRAWKV